LAVVVYIDGSYIKHKIPVKPIYVTVRNLNSVVSGKACAWRVLGMMPSLKKSATLAQTDSWRKDRRLRLHHAGLSHIVNMINKFGSEDQHILCADGQVMICIYTYILLYTVIYMYILRYTCHRCGAVVPISILSAWTELRLLSTVFAQLVRAQRAGARTVSWLTVIVESAITAGWQR
jgi:hypothetical protein